MEEQEVSSRRFKKSKGNLNLDYLMLNNQQGSILCDQKLKGRRKQVLKIYTEETKGWHCFEEDSYEEEPVILDREVEAALKVLGRNKSPEQIGYQ